jgi:hypothetical protein
VIQEEKNHVEASEALFSVARSRDFPYLRPGRLQISFGSSR